MKQTYFMPLTQTEMLVESNAMQMTTPQSQINPAEAPSVPDTPINIPGGAPKRV